MWKFQELSLEGLSLSAVPSEVWESGEVIKVDLSRNAIQELPVELSSCISLQVNFLVDPGLYGFFFFGFVVWGVFFGGGGDNDIVKCYLCWQV